MAFTSRASAYLSRLGAPILAKRWQFITADEIYQKMVDALLQLEKSQLLGKFVRTVIPSQAMVRIKRDRNG